MAKSENTAINELIARVSGGQTSSPADASDDPALDHAITIPVGAALHATTRPASMPVAAPFEAQTPGMPTSYPVVPRAMLQSPEVEPPSTAPLATPYPEMAPSAWTPPAPAPAPASAFAPAAVPAWSPPPSGAVPTVPLNAPRTGQPEHMIGTLRLTRRSDLQIVLGRLVLPMTLLLVAGMLIGGYVAFRGERGVPRVPAAPSGGESHAGAQAHLAEPPVDPTPPPAGEAQPASAPVAAPSAAGAPAAAGTAMAAPAAPAAPAANPPSPSATAGGPAAAPAAPSAAAHTGEKPASPPAAPAPPDSRGNAASSAASTAPAATPAPAPAPSRPPAPPTPPAPPAPSGTAASGATPPPAPAAALVDVRIESTPRGATVTLVDRGKSQYVGTTPVSAAVDPTRTYDLVFSYPGKPTLTEHLDAAANRRVSVTLGGKPAPETVSRHSPKVSGDPAPSRKAPRPAPPAAPVTNDGILKISTKPPCEIIIDGRPTGLVTPQNEIVLPAGVHRVTLINTEKDISRTFSVELAAGTTEKIIEDFLAGRPR
ncbi:MAG TPA: PEGA domain-containing protein [Kofleriaceae bacterium]|nr:PEGA domain-containing protein [Kofleriaceae bacterium]